MKENNIRVFLIVDCERILTLRQHCYGALILTFCRIRHIAVWMAASKSLQFKPFGSAGR
jgi:hypothetical protein